MRMQREHVGLTRAVLNCIVVFFVVLFCCGLVVGWALRPFCCKKKRKKKKEGEVRFNTKNNNQWRKTFSPLLAGQAISFISSGILQMAIIFYLVAKTNSAIILTAATLIGFLPQACLGPFAGAFVDRHSRKSVMIGAGFDNCRRWRYSGAGGVFTWNCPYGLLWLSC